MYLAKWRSLCKSVSVRQHWPKIPGSYDKLGGATVNYISAIPNSTSDIYSAFLATFKEMIDLLNPQWKILKYSTSKPITYNSGQ